MTLLDDLQTTLSQIATVRVAAHFRSDKLRFPGPNDLRVFIPDMHLVPASARQRFSFSGPAPSHALLTQTLERVKALRASAKAANPSAVCALYFMGDFLDLWRAAPPGTDPGVAANEIALEHADLLRLACGPELKARFLLGNHDFELCRVPSFAASDRRYFFPATAPSAVAMHGDVFDWIEDMPDRLNELAVYYLSPFANLLDHAFDQIKAFIRSSNESGRVAPNEVAAAPPDAATAVATTRAAAEASHDLFRRAFECRNFANQNFGLDLRTIVIGHTHGPRIVPYESGTDFFTLVDTGGWLEDVRDNDGTTQKGMVTGFCQNEIRIFELRA
jgi:UDP-2,3-diacylglucosamine pyrophosphatase LpxH